MESNAPRRSGLGSSDVDSVEPADSHRMTSLGNESKPTAKAQRRLSRDSTRHSSQRSSTRCDISGSYAGLGELATPSPVQRPDEDSLHRRATLEDATRLEQDYGRYHTDRVGGGKVEKEHEIIEVSKFATQMYTISYLILFAILGTLARLGLQAITFYPGVPVVFSELWANFGGSVIIGFLSEDRMLFRDEWGSPIFDRQLKKARRASQHHEGGPKESSIDLTTAKKAHGVIKKTIPLYIGLATGFCGSFTSFSSFIRDVFLALSNDLPIPLSHPGYPSMTSSTSTIPRNGGYSFMAVLAIIITTVSVCISGLHLGAHVALALEPYIPMLPFSFTRKFLDPIAVFIAWSAWLGSIILSIFPPDRHSSSVEIWRGRAMFALVFAPLGCLARFYASLYLNGKIMSFPLGTFVVNIFGTIILGMAWDLQHVPLGGIIGCQVLQGIQDGFCGCMTTVSTWVSELSTLRMRHAYIYGTASVLLALGCLVIIMGSLRWTQGISTILCTH